MSCLDALRNYAAQIHCAFKEGEPLSAYTTFRIGGQAELMLFPENAEMLSRVLACCAELGEEPFLLGKGSNLLIDDDGLSGVTVCTERMTACRMVSETDIECDAGVPLVKLCKFALEHALTGLEFAYGIPGSVGGAVYMNAGAYGGEMRDVVYSCRAIDRSGNMRTLDAEQLGFGYRTSVFQENGSVVASAVFHLQKGNEAQIRAQMEDILNRRKEKQPLNYPSAGSAFKRPEGHFAGALIERCGLKGYAVGGAQVSEKHAGFIVNRGGATAKDVMQLIRYVQCTVKAQTGVSLEPEIRCITR